MSTAQSYARTFALVTGPREAAFQSVLRACLVGLGIFLPFSTAGTSIFLFGLVLLAVCVPLRVAALAPWRQPLIAVGLLLLAWIALRSLAETATVREKIASVNRYHELLMIPLVWCMLRIARDPNALWRGLLAGTFAYAAAHWLVPLAPPQFAHWLETRRISGGLVFCVCAFLLFEHARTKDRGRWAARIGALFLLATALFFSDGRTGHLLVLVMLGCTAWRAAPRRHRMAAALLVVLAAVCVALLSTSVRLRLAETLEAAQADQHGAVAASSTGYRLQVWRNGAAVARDNALLGTGWSGFAQAYAAAAAKSGVKDKPWTHSDNPHNEYLMQLGAGGVVSLALFLLWLGVPVRDAWRSRHADLPWPPLLACVTLAFAVGCMFNSLLLDFAGGHFHAAVMAWLLARREQA